MHKIKKETWQTIGLLVAIAVVVVGVLIWNGQNPIDYTMYSASGIRYESGTVIEVQSESTEPMDGDSDRLLGEQILTVRMDEGELKGQEITVVNNLSTTHNIYTLPGDKVIVKVDAPEGVEPFYSIYNYDRNTGLIVIVLIFIALIAVVGRKKGIKSIVGLLFTMFLILCFLLPMIYQGYSPVWVSVITILVSVVVSMLLLNGFSKKTAVAITATIIGVLLAALVFSIFSSILNLSGYNLEEAEELILISQHTGLQISQVLFAGILIASLGAVMDITMSVAAALHELHLQKPDMNAKHLFRSGMSIGHDMIGTMCETLVLAFTGTAITTLLVLISYGVQFQQLISSDYIAIEIVHAITGSIAVILAVPLTSFLYAAFAAKSEVRHKR